MCLKLVRSNAAFVNYLNIKSYYTPPRTHTPPHTLDSLLTSMNEGSVGHIYSMLSVLCFTMFFSGIQMYPGFVEPVADAAVEVFVISGYKFESALRWDVFSLPQRIGLGCLELKMAW